LGLSVNFVLGLDLQARPSNRCGFDFQWRDELASLENFLQKFENLKNRPKPVNKKGCVVTKK
jgi:hypothetical protein